MRNNETTPISISRRRFASGMLGAVAAGAVLPALAGCAGGSGSGGTSWQASTWESAAEMKKWQLYIGQYFKTKQPDFKWNVDYGTPFDKFFQKLQTTIAGGGKLDMCWMHPRFVPQFANTNLLEPLDDLIAKAPPPQWPNDYSSAQVNVFKSKGKQYAMPYDHASGGFYVNVDWFKRAKLDLPDENWTFEQLLEAAKALKATAKKPDSSWGMSLPTNTVPMYWLVRSFGGDFFSGGESPVSHLTDEGTVAAFQYLYDAIWTHKVMPTPAQLSTADANGAGDLVLFGAERLPIIYQLNDAAFSLKDFVNGKFTWTVAPTPKGAQRRFQEVGGSGFSLPKTTRHPDVSFEIMKLLMSDPSSLPTIAKMGSLTPARTSFAKYGVPPSSVVPAKDFSHTFQEFVERDGVAQTFFPTYAQWESSVFQAQIDGLWTNTAKDVRKVLTTMDEQTKPLIRS